MTTSISGVHTQADLVILYIPSVPIVDSVTSGRYIPAPQKSQEIWAQNTIQIPHNAEMFHLDFFPQNRTFSFLMHFIQKTDFDSHSILAVLHYKAYVIIFCPSNSLFH